MDLAHAAHEHARVYNGRNGPVLRVSLTYMFTGLVLFLVMGILGLLMRLMHAGLLPLAPYWYYRLMTLHGAGMIGAVLIASMGGIVALLSHRLHFNPRLMWVGYVLYLLGVGYIPVAVLIGGFAAGWTILYPLPVVYQAGWSAWATFAFLLGYLFIALGFAFYSLALVLAAASAHGGISRALAWNFLFSGGKKGKEHVPPLPDIAITVIGITGIVTVLVGAVALVPFFGQNLGLIEGINALFMKNFIFLFGHTLVNIDIYLAAAMIYTTVPLYVDRHWASSWLSVFALNLLLIFMFLPYFHHLYEDFAQPVILPVLGLIGSYGAGLSALLVTVLGCLYMVYRSNIRWSAAMILVLLGVWGWVFGGIGALVDSTTPINQVFHNTLWVPGHFHTYFLLGGAAVTWGIFYHLVVELAGRAESRASRAAAWLFGIGGAGFVFMFFTAGAAGQPRRYAVPLAGSGEQLYATLAALFVVVLGAGFLVMLYDWLVRLKPSWQQTRQAVAPEAVTGAD